MQQGTRPGVRKVDHQPDRKPDEETDPGSCLKKSGQREAKRNGQCRHDRHTWATERPWQVRSGPAQDDDRNGDQAKGRQRAQVDQFSQYIEGNNGSSQTEQNANHPRGKNGVPCFG